MNKEKTHIVLITTKSYDKENFIYTKDKWIILFLNPKLKEAGYLETEIFRSIFGEDLGKKEFFLEAGSYGNIIEAYEKTLRTLLEKEHKVPKEYYDKLEEYRKVVYRNLFTLEDYVDNKHRYDEVHEVLGEYYVLPMRFPFQRVPYEFNRYYLSIKRLFDSGEPLFISSTMFNEDLPF